MTQCCKLYLIPEDVIQTWRAEQRVKTVDKPVETVASKVDARMTDLLEAPSLSDYDKEKLFSQELAKFLNMRKQQQQQQQLQLMQQPPPPPLRHDTTHSKTAMDEQLMSSIPKTYKSKATGLMHFLRSDPNISWDEQGQLSIGDTKYEGSHIVDLINDAVRMRKKVSRPSAWRELSEHLAQRNVPRELVGNQEWVKGYSRDVAASFARPHSLETFESVAKPYSQRQHQSKLRSSRPYTTPIKRTPHSSRTEHSSPAFYTPSFKIKKEIDEAKWEEVKDEY